MDRKRRTTPRRRGLAAATVVVALGLLGGTASPASAASACATTGPLICIDVVGTPGSVSPSTVLSPTFVSYGVTITNRAPSTATHLTLKDTLPAGSTLVSATPSTGTCGSAAGVVTCTFGSLASNGQVTATVLVQAPATTGAVANTATASFDERANDAPAADPKQDTVTVSEPTTVQAIAGSAASLVPSGQEVRIDTDPTGVDVASPQDANIGKARVPASEHPPVRATLNEEIAPFTCPKKEVCRDGAWLHAEIPGTFSPALEFELHWSKTLVPAKQSVKNLSVLHTDCLVTCPVEIVARRCTSSTPLLGELPCLSGVAETATEFRATLHSKTNGYMR